MLEPNHSDLLQDVQPYHPVLTENEDAFDKRILIAGMTASGKSTTNDLLTGRVTRRMHLEPVTVRTEVCRKSIPNPGGERTICQVISTVGFVGNEIEDSFGILRTLDDISKMAQVTSIDLILYCISSEGRFGEDDQRSLKTVANLLGPEFVDRTVFVFTHTADELIDTDFIPAAHRKLTKVLGCRIDYANVITWDLEDPQKYPLDSPDANIRATRARVDAYWARKRQDLNQRIINLPEGQGLSLSSITLAKKCRSIARAFRVHIILSISIFIIFALVASNMLYYQQLLQAVEANEYLSEALREAEEKMLRSDNFFGFGQQIRKILFAGPWEFITKLIGR